MALQLPALAILSVFFVAAAGKTGTPDLLLPSDGAERPPGRLEMRLTHAKAHLPPGARLPTPADLARGDRRRLEARGSAGTPVWSNAPAGEAQYVVEVGFGTPQPAKQRLIVDTGSDLLWTKCRYRSESGRRGAKGLFDADASPTFEPVKCGTEQCKFLDTSACSRRLRGLCGYNYSYVDGSLAEGVLAYDAVALGGAALDIAFGCTDVARGESFQLSQGVLGLGAEFVSFASQVDGRYGNRFSYCLVDHLSNPTASSLLVFGARRLSRAERGRLRSTPLVKNPALPSYYYADVESLGVDGEALKIPRSAWEIRSDGGGGTVFDSGTSLTYLVGPAFEAVYAAFDRLLPRPRASVDPFPLCFKNAGVKKAYPKLVFHFRGGAPFAPPVNNYIFEVEPGVSCLAIAESVGTYASNLVGNILQQNFVVEYDRAASQLRFAPTDCSKS